MKTLLPIVVAILIMIPGVPTTNAGDQEWRTFGEVAAALFGIRALTGYDPAGYVLDCPRTRYRRYVDAQRSQPVVVYYSPPYDNRKISAYPVGYTNPAAANISASDVHSRNPDGSVGSAPATAPRQAAAEDGSARMPATPPPNMRPPVEITRRVEGDFEIITRRVWTEPHWETTVIDGHWRGDTWVETHSERKWVDGHWKEVEEKKSLKTSHLKKQAE